MNTMNSSVIYKKLSNVPSLDMFLRDLKFNYEVFADAAELVATAQKRNTPQWRNIVINRNDTINTLIDQISGIGIEAPRKLRLMEEHADTQIEFLTGFLRAFAGQEVQSLLHRRAA